jgi:hypothetical protein
MSEDFDMSELADEEGDDPQWAALKVEQKKELLANVFEDEDWYDGIPAHVGGNSLPEFSEISQRTGAPKDDLRDYYVAWLKMKGYNPKEIMSRGTTSIGSQPSQPQPQPQPVMSESPPPSFGGASTSSSIKGALVNDMVGDVMSSNKSGDPMGEMMKFMMLNQIIESENRRVSEEARMRQQQFDVQQSNTIRQETAARQDQMVQMQMNMMNQWFKNTQKQTDGFFDDTFKDIMKEKLVDSVMGNSSESTLEKVLTRVMDPQLLGAAVSGAKSAFGGANNNVPMGYDSPSYNPYAQPMVVDSVPQEQVEELPQGEAPPQPPQEQPPTDYEPTPDEYKEALINAFKELMGPQMEDPKKREALVAQVDIAVEDVTMKHPELTPENKLAKMQEQLVLVRSLRDIGMGIREAHEQIEKGVEKEMVLNYIKGQLQNQPTFLMLFTNYDYEGMMALVEPYKDTGGVTHDYNFLLKPEIARLVRDILTHVKE